MRDDTKMALVVPLFAAIGAGGGLMAGLEGGTKEYPFAGAMIGGAVGAFMGFLVTVPPRQPDGAQQVGTSSSPLQVLGFP